MNKHGFPALVRILVLVGAASALAAARAGTAPASLSAAADSSASIDDPDLAPVPPAPQYLSDFRELAQKVAGDSADVTVARLEIERSRGSARQALAQVLPTISLSGVVQHEFVSGTAVATSAGIVATSATSANATLTVAQPLIAPRALYALRTSKLSVESAKRSAADRQRTALGSAAAAVVAVVSAERAADVSRVGLRWSLNVLALTSRKVEFGSATRLDRVRAEQDVSAARASVVTANESLRRARESLGLALGSATAYGISPDLRLDALEGALRAHCVPASTESRPDVLAARADAEVADRGITDAKLAYSPSLSLTGTGLLSTTPLTTGKSDSFSLQGLLTVPLWDGGARDGAVRSARAFAEQKHAQLAATQRSATVQFTQAIRAVTVAQQAHTVAVRTRELASEVARLTCTAFTTGSGTSFDVVEAARKQRETELDLIAKDHDLLRARIDALFAAATCSY